MSLIDYIAYFFAGAFIANAVPHLVNGISGRPFQSPFASPPGKGLSSSTVNVLWSAVNLMISYLLLCNVGYFDIRDGGDALALGLGALLLSFIMARHFGKLNGGNL